MPSTETAQNAAPAALVLPTVTAMTLGPDGAPLRDSTANVVLVPMEGEGGKKNLVALAFTSVPALVEAIGEEQSWAIIPTEEAGKALSGSRAAAVLIDPQLADSPQGGPASG